MGALTTIGTGGGQPRGGGVSAPFSDAMALIRNGADPTKQAILSAQNLTPGLTRTIFLPDGLNLTLVSDADLLTTFNSLNNIKLSTCLNLLSYQALGSPIQIQTVDSAFATMSTLYTMASGTVNFVALEYNHNPLRTFSGLRFWQYVLGGYTASANNRVGLYSYSGGNLSLVASSANDGTLWQTSASMSMLSVPFSSTYQAPAGQYFAGFLYCRSAEVTAPALGVSPPLINAAMSGLDFTNSGKLYAALTSQTDLPSSVAMSSITAVPRKICVGVY